MSLLVTTQKILSDNDENKPPDIEDFVENLKSAERVDRRKIAIRISSGLGKLFGSLINNFFQLPTAKHKDGFDQPYLPKDEVVD